MLKDRYPYKLSLADATQLSNTLQRTFAAHHNATDLHVMLPLTVLKAFQKRLIGALAFPSPVIKMHLKQPEAIAFQVMYLTDMIETTNETRQISYQIDRTLPRRT